MEWIKYIRIEDLPEDYRIAAEAIGLEAVIKLAFALPKVYLYLRSPDKLFYPAKRQLVLEMYRTSGPGNPWRPRLAALAAGLSVDQVYRIIREHHPHPHQTSLFDE